MTSRSPVSTSPSHNSSSSSSYYDDSSDIDELDQRARKLTRILRKNVNRSEKRKSIMDVVKNRAWLLEDQVKLLEEQTANVRSSLARKSCRRCIAVCFALILSVILFAKTFITSS